MKKLGLIGGLVLTIGLAGAVNKFQNSFKKSEFNKTTNSIDMGSIKYITSPAKSLDFFSCTGVILDYQNKAVFAHATPWYIYNREMIKRKALNPSSDYLDTDEVGVDYLETNGANVVKKLIRESERRGLDPKEGKAIVIAGEKEELEEILSNLHAEGISVKTQKLYKNYDRSNGKLIARDIYFDPFLDKLIVKEH